MYRTNPEYLTLRKIANLVNLQNGTLVDIGAHDGISGSCMFTFWKDETDKWNGLAVEIDSNRCNNMRQLYNDFNVNIVNEKVTPHNICNILSSNNINSDFDMINIDIDSYDLDVARSMLDGGFKPKIITIEVNPIIPTPIYFEILYHPDHEHRANPFMGSSLTALADTIIPHGYILYEHWIGNAFFVREDIAKDKIPAMTVEEAYDIGWRKMPNWKEHFWYFELFRPWLDMSPEDAVKDIDKVFKEIINGTSVHTNPSWPGKYWWDPKYILEIRNKD